MIERLRARQSRIRRLADGPGITGVDVTQAAGPENPPSDDIGALKQRVGSLELAVETLLMMLIDYGRISEKEFLALSEQIDAEDGLADGQRDQRAMRRICPACKRTNTGDKAQCVWCGTDITGAELLPATK
jgi:hypothetical protein